MLYYIIIGLQIYCAYHAYTTKNNFYWYLVIFLAPGLGSLIYLITQVFTKKDADKVHQELTTVLNPTKKIRDLEKKVDFSDTFKNRVDLADAHFDNNDFQNAINHYSIALNGSHKLDFHANSQMLKSYYEVSDFEKTAAIADQIKTKPEFEKSNTQFIYGLSLSKLGHIAEAEDILKKIDQRYSNYAERLILAQFLQENGKTSESKEILTEMLSEKEYMTKPNRRLHNRTFLEISKFYSSLE